MFLSRFCCHVLNKAWPNLHLDVVVYVQTYIPLLYVCMLVRGVHFGWTVVWHRAVSQRCQMNLICHNVWCSVGQFCWSVQEHNVGSQPTVISILGVVVVGHMLYIILNNRYQ